MPYYLYKITSGPGSLVKTLEKLEEFESFKEARNRARDMRAEMSLRDQGDVREQ